MPEDHLPLLQEVFLEHLYNYKIRITQRLVEDIVNIENDHKRAHRNARGKNLETYHFPHMSKLIRDYITVCEICLNNKYDTIRDQKYKSCLFKDIHAKFYTWIHCIFKKKSS